MKKMLLMCLFAIFFVGCASSFKSFYNPWFNENYFPQEAYLKEGEEPLMCPDLRLSFGVDGLESSVEAGKWVCDTDSGISLSIGRREILQMM